MTRILLHIGPDSRTTRSVQDVSLRNRDRLAARGWLYPDGMGKTGQTGLFLASLDPGHVDPLRAARGLAPEDRQIDFANRIRAQLTKLRDTAPEVVFLCCDLIGRDLAAVNEIERLHDLLQILSNDITVLIHVPELATGLCAHWSTQMVWGRVTPISQDLTAASPAHRRMARPEMNDFPELEDPPRWRDLNSFVTSWENVFADVRVLPERKALHEAIDLPCPPLGSLPSAQTLARFQELNPLIQLELSRGLILPRRHRGRLLEQIAVDGPSIDPATVAVALANPSNPPPLLPPCTDDFEPKAIMSQLIGRMIRLTRAADIGRDSMPPAPVSPSPNLPKAAHNQFARLVHSAYAPHNRHAPAPVPDCAFLPTPHHDASPPERVLVACMKDEAPYLLEWLAYHRSIGIDHFLIYTNDCSDGTDQMLDRVARQGWLTHVDNSDWHGKSPQQSALNNAITRPIIQHARWVLHTDVDEFVNIRCGNGTLDDLFDACPEATHFALTWRLFGSAGVTQITDEPVISQFTRCAPAFCPKPHTAWGFKTLGRQIDAYGKLSCHRPTKPVEKRMQDVHWVNGSGTPMGPDIARKGWRSNIKTIGYDLVQLNHYALRSRDSFLIKRKRGRALHVDRQIGHNYWVRMDWNDYEDRSILRNLPRLTAALADLKTDQPLAQMHDDAVGWHQERAKELKQDPDIAALITTTAKLRLTQSERAAYALTLDMES